MLENPRRTISALGGLSALSVRGALRGPSDLSAVNVSNLVSALNSIGTLSAISALSASSAKCRQ